MTHLVIENQNSNVEIVSAAIILKIYEMALSAEGDVSLKGNLLTTKCKLNAYDYLTGDLPDSNDKRFPNLSINVTLGLYMAFQDPEVERVLLALNIGDGVGITRDDAAALTGQFNGNNSPFMNNTAITSFDEFGYFGYTSLYSNLWDVGAFRGCTNLTSIDLKNITSVGRFSFSGCLNLESVGLFHGTTIENIAFLNCSKLSSIDLSNVTSIGERSFDGCTALTEIDLSSVTNVSGSSSTNGAFIHCTGLTTVTNLNKTGLYMFYGCTGLTSVGLTLNCTSVARNAFNGCTLLSNIDLSHVTTFGVLAFKGCTSLLSIDLSSCTSLPGYPGETFYGCTSLTHVDGLSSINEVGFAIFLGCTNLGQNEDLVINTTLTALGANTFNNTKYKSVVLNGPNCTNIANYSGSGIQCSFHYMPNLLIADFSNTSAEKVPGMNGCPSLLTLILPSTSNFMSWSMFDNNSGTRSATYIIILATTPPTIESDLYYTIPNDHYIYVPDSALSDYQSALYWSGNKLLSHLKPLSELPVGVWKTGLYLLYEPYLSNSSDPAYATT